MYTAEKRMNIITIKHCETWKKSDHIKGPVLNWALSSLYGWSLEITDPLIVYRKLVNLK